MWTDSRLSWDPKDFDYCKEWGSMIKIVYRENLTCRVIPVKEVRLKPSDVWKPNIIVYNSDDGDFKSYIQGKIFQVDTWWSQ